MIWIQLIVYIAFLVYIFINIPKWDLKDKATTRKLFRLFGLGGLILYALHLLSKYLD